MTEKLQVALVDWDQFVETWSKQGSASFYFDALINEEDWIEPCQSLVFSNWDHALAVSQRYSTLRDHLEPQSRSRFDLFLGAFFWGDQPRRDIDHPDAQEFLALLSPESVSKYLELWKQLDLKELRKPFDACREVLPEPKTTSTQLTKSPKRLRDFQKDFRRYIEQWGDILDEAEDQGLGIVAFVA